MGRYGGSRDRQYPNWGIPAMPVATFPVFAWTSLSVYRGAAGDLRAAGTGFPDSVFGAPHPHIEDGRSAPDRRCHRIWPVARLKDDLRCS